MTSYFSNFIAYSRFPIIFGVVCIHAGFCSSHGLLYFVMGECFGRIGVPLFFFISGYLFFQNYVNTKKNFLDKIKKRFFSLFIPYLLWNFIAFIIYSNVTETMSLDQFFQAFWVVDGKEGHSPADGPLWFVRALMIYSIIAPLFFLLNRHRFFSWLSPFFLLIWLLDAPLFKSGFVIGFVFFNFGAWMALTDWDRKVPIPQKWQGVSFFFVYSIGVFVHYYFKCAQMHNFLILIGFCLIYCLPSLFKSRYVTRLGAWSFGLYCIHEIILEIIKAFDMIPINVGNLKYCLAIFCTTIISLFITWLLQREFPRAAQYLLGKRN